MKILHITRQFYPAIGGMESAILGLGKALTVAGHECSIATLRHIYQTGENAPLFDEVEGLPVYRLPHWGGSRYPVAPAVLKLVENHDVLHIHAIDFFVDYLNLTRFLHRKPIIVSTHGGIFHTRWLLPLKKAWFYTITRFSLSGATWVVGISHHDMDLCRPIVSPGKLRHIPNGVDINKLLSQPRQPEYGLLVGVGRQVVNKRIEWIIDAISRLKTEFPALRLAWIGPGSETRRLNQLAADLGVDDRVQIIGSISAEERDAWLARAQFFVSAASYEAFGISTIEALAAGAVPVVSTVGVHPEVVQSGVNGWLWTGSVDSLVESLRQALATNPAQLSRMSDLSRIQARRYSWDNVASEYVELYKKMAR